MAVVGERPPAVDLTNIEAIGVDDLSCRRGQRYLTLAYQIDGHSKRLLWVGRERTAATLEGFFDWFGPPAARAPPTTSRARHPVDVSASPERFKCLDRSGVQQAVPQPGDVGNLRSDVREMGERLRNVEIQFAKVDQRLLTLERAIIPAADSDE